MKIDPVYFITAIEMRPLSLSINEVYIKYQLQFYDDINALVFNARTLLWLPTYEEAEEFVTNDTWGLSEGGTNEWACIEGITPTIMFTNPYPQVFFKYEGSYDDDTGHYVKIDGWPKPVKDYYDKNHLVRTIATIG